MPVWHDDMVTQHQLKHAAQKATSNSFAHPGCAATAAAAKAAMAAVELHCQQRHEQQQPPTAGTDTSGASNTAAPQAPTVVVPPRPSGRWGSGNNETGDSKTSPRAGTAVPEGDIEERTPDEVLESRHKGNAL